MQHKTASKEGRQEKSTLGRPAQVPGLPALRGRGVRAEGDMLAGTELSYLLYPRYKNVGAKTGTYFRAAAAARPRSPSGSAFAQSASTCRAAGVSRWSRMD